MSKQGLTLILKGGWTAEAEISRASGEACLNAALTAGWEAEALEMDRNLPAELVRLKPKRIFNALHGKMGEDGNVQGLLNLMAIPYTHSGVLASAVAMDKRAAKLALAPLGIEFPANIAFEIKGDKLVIDSSDAVVVKPCSDGSSIGVVLAPNPSDIPPYSFWDKGTELMVEPLIDGRELTVAVLDGKALTVTEIIQDNQFYDYEAKYAKGGSTHTLPADLPIDIFKRCLEWSSLAHQKLGCRGVSRADFRFDDKSGELFMLEINTQPGMTDTSLVPEQAAHCGISMPDLVSGLLEGARCD